MATASNLLSSVKSACPRVDLSWGCATAQPRPGRRRSLGMAIPGPVADLLYQINVIGLPTRANPGQLVTGTLTPSPVGFDAFAIGKTLAELDVGVDLTPGSITTTL